MEDKKFEDIVLYELRELRKAVDKINGRFNKYNIKLVVMALGLLALAGEKFGLTKLIF